MSDETVTSQYDSDRIQFKDRFEHMSMKELARRKPVWNWVIAVCYSVILIQLAVHAFACLASTISLCD